MAYKGVKVHPWMLSNSSPNEWFKTVQKEAGNTFRLSESIHSQSLMSGVIRSLVKPVEKKER
jgi:hypothetical protein